MAGSPIRSLNVWLCLPKQPHSVKSEHLRKGLTLDGSIAVLTLLVVSSLLGFLSPVLTLVLLTILFIPYVVLVGLLPSHIKRFSLPADTWRIAWVIPRRAAPSEY